MILAVLQRPIQPSCEIHVGKTSKRAVTADQAGVQPKTGTIVTSFATPYFAPPTIEATWVPCPLQSVPLAGSEPLTAWHEAHWGRLDACEDQRWNKKGWRGRRCDNSVLVV